MYELGAVLAGSFLASAHCVGMCGGLAAALGATRPRLAPMLARQAAYTAGRIFTYAFLGAVGGFAGLRLSGVKLPLVEMQQLFSMLAGVLMVLMGLQVLGLLPVRGAGEGTLGRIAAPLFNHFLNARGAWGHFSAGLANGFLPCGLVYAFLAMAVASGSVHQGLLIMAVFGLGTAPAMLLVGCGGGLIGRAARHRMLRVAAAFMVVMGGLAIYRAWPGRGGACCDHSAGDDTAALAGLRPA